MTGGIGPNFIEFAIGSLFACTCTVPGHDVVFGSSTTPFSTKKAARSNAAKEAVQFLISQGLTNPDGSVKARKKGIPGKTVKVEGKALEVKMDASFAQKVNGMYPFIKTSSLHSLFFIIHFNFSSSYKQICAAESNKVNELAARYQANCIQNPYSSLT